MTCKKSSSPRYQIYQLKISLLEIEPPIWRRLLVRSDTKFPALSRIFETAMGWQGYHQHTFKIFGSEYGVADPTYPELKIVDEKNRKLGDISSEAGASFVYEYDFGDWWRHEVSIEQIKEPEAGKKYPICIEGERACPPEDCGGTWGYQELLGALKDPMHEEHESMAEWAGEDFNPEEFNLVAVNDALRKG